VALLGGGLVALLTLTSTDWFFPTALYTLVVYIAWQEFFD
jgi:hypothetical protein